MTRQTTFVCPKCGLTVDALAGSTVTHECPANQRRTTQFQPQPTRKDPIR